MKGGGADLVKQQVGTKHNKLSSFTQFRCEKNPPTPNSFRMFDCV